jgi:hypothetical protein
MTSLSKLVLRGLLEPGGAVSITTDAAGEHIVYSVKDKFGRSQVRTPPRPAPPRPAPGG